MSKIKNIPNPPYSFLKQIIIVAVLCSLSIVLYETTNKFFRSIPFYIRKFLFLDFVGIIPFLLIPLYISNNNASKFLVFFGVSCSEALGFFIFRFKTYTFSFILNFAYAICWGFLPNFFFKTNYSFLKTYFLILLLFIFHYLFVTLLGACIYFNLITYNISILSFLTSHNFVKFIFDKRYYFIIRFFSLPIVAFAVAFLYLRIKHRLMMFV